jgi:hypothetical protein
MGEAKRRLVALEEESKDLEGKIQKLAAYLATDVTVEVESDPILIRQLVFMEAYGGCLRMRIKGFIK